MKYYQLLNCKHDPFPSTPSLDRYLPVGPHEKCINNLLSVVDNANQPLTAVLGSSGIGKTTILFQLKEKLNDSKVVLTSADDSWFASQQIFIEHLAEFLNVTTSDNPTDQLLHNRIQTVITAKENIKKHHLLIIDQAEKIPSFCFEQLEKLFTKKVNAQSLQVIVFARPIFNSKISHYYNLAQSSSLIKLPEKFNSPDAMGIVDYYLTESESSLDINSLFSKAAQHYIYHLCKGHPGKILDLCQLTLLNLIVQDRSKAGIILCHKSAKEIFPERAKALEKLRISGLAAATAVALIYLTVTDQNISIPTSQSTSQTIVADSSAPAVDTKLPSESTTQPKQVVSSAEKNLTKINTPKSDSESHVADILKSLQANKGDESPASSTVNSVPELLGEISVFEQETLGDMIRRIYGPYSFNQINTEKLLLINPHVRNKHSLSVGDTIKFPSLAVNLTKTAKSSWWINLATIDKLQDAYRYLRIYASKTEPLLIIPSWDEKGSLKFSIMLQKNFSNQQEAEKKLTQLSPDIFPTAELVDGLSHESFYYAESEETDAEKTKTTTIAKVNIEQPPQSVTVSASVTTDILEKSPAINPISNDKTSQLPDTKNISNKPVPEINAKEEKRSVTTIEKTQNSSALTDATNITKPSVNQMKMPAMLGKLIMAKGSTLGHMIRGVYGKHSVTKNNINWLAKNNQHINNPNNIPLGTTIDFPVKAVNLPAGSDSDWWVQIDTFTTLQDAFTHLRKQTPKKSWLLIIPTFEADTIRFNLIVEQSFKQEEKARAKLKQLSNDGFASVSLIDGISSKKYFYKLR